MHTEKSPVILAIETSCDDTAASVVSLEDDRPTVLSSVVSSQIELHRRYGGVVPALAAREHVKNLVPVIDEALHASGIGRGDIDAIAVTQGPGLIPALLAGVSAAKTLALVWRKPLLGIHHIEGHIYANFIRDPATDNSQPTTEESTVFQNSKFEIRNSQPFPLLALVVSGGHTELVLMRDHFEYEILGRTKDDAAGEAFDKVAKMLGLPYPGGPEVAARAEQYQKQEPSLRDGPVKAIQDSKSSGSPRSRGLELAMTDKKGFHFPRPMIDSGNYDFSFSGLKTAVLYEIRKTPEAKRDEVFVTAVCHAFQEAVVDVLTAKTRRAIEEYAPATLVIAGGVSANVSLRESLTAMVASEFPHTDFIVPEFKYSLDNAAMIGAAAILRYTRLSPEEREAAKRNAVTLEPDANLPLSA